MAASASKGATESRSVPISTTPASAAAALPLRELLVNGETVRAVTQSLSVRRMHAAAKKIRDDGGEIFFAALEE